MRRFGADERHVAACSCKSRRNAWRNWKPPRSSADRGTLAEEARMIGAAAEQLASRGLGDCARRIELAAQQGDFDQVKADLEYAQAGDPVAGNHGELIRHDRTNSQVSVTSAFGGRHIADRPAQHVLAVQIRAR